MNTTTTQTTAPTADELREWRRELGSALRPGALPLRLADAYQDQALKVRRLREDVRCLLLAAGLPETEDVPRACVVIRDRVARGAAYVSHSSR